MTGYLLVFATILAGQVNSSSDRYGTSGQNRQAAANQPPSQTGDGLVPILGAQPPDSGTNPANIPPARGNAEQFGNSPAPPTASQRSFPFGNQAAPPPSNSPPPGFGGFQQQSPPPAPNSPPVTSTAVVKPSALMKSMLSAPANSRLTGESITLAEVVAGASSRAEQLQRIDAYWDLCSSVADYYLGLGEQDELRRLRPAAGAGTAWEQAEKELALRIGTSERAARASQMRLASWSGQLANLPLPGDMPHCGNYHSHYDEIFVGRPNAEAQELSALLPLRYAELKDAAMAVTRAQEWLNTIASMRNENPEGVGTLRALELWALRRRAFVQIARDYNRRIARYAELATPGQMPADRLVGMLIFRDTASTATRPANAAIPTNRQSNNSGAVPRTFSGGWSPAASTANGAMRDEAVEPASVESQSAPRQERSLLVKPKWDR